MNKLCGLLLIALMVSCSTRTDPQKPNETSNKVKISAVDLHKEFLVDKNAALERYKNKKIEVKGKILNGITNSLGSLVYLGEAKDPLRPFEESDHAISCRIVDSNRNFTGVDQGTIVLTCSRISREDSSTGFMVNLDGCSVTDGPYLEYGAQSSR